MLRQTFAPLANANRAVMRRSFCISAARLGEGDAGAPRSGAGGSSGYVIYPLIQLCYKEYMGNTKEQLQVMTELLT